MTISTKSLIAPAAALAFLSLSACGDNPATTDTLPPPSGVTDTATPVPPGTLPEAPPEQIAPSATTPDPTDPTDGQAVPPASPPPVLPETPPT